MHQVKIDVTVNPSGGGGLLIFRPCGGGFLEGGLIKEGGLFKIL